MMHAQYDNSAQKKSERKKMDLGKFSITSFAKNAPCLYKRQVGWV